MELDLYELYRLLCNHPAIEIRFEADEYFGLRVRAINFDAEVGPLQKMHLFPVSDMEKMRGSEPIRELLSSMIKEVIKESWNNETK